MKIRLVIKGLLFFIAGGFLSLTVLGLVSYLSNRSLPVSPAETDQLTDIDKIRLEETLHLKTVLGEVVWPGWGGMDIPILLWHQGNNFLVGIDDPPSGWQVVTDDQFQGASYYANPAFDPENFAMNIGGQWVASMASKSETDQFMQDVFRGVIPDPLENFFPYRLLILNTEIQISGVLHETFHVYQAIQSPENFTRAESVYQSSDRYWDLDKNMEAAWGQEMDLLIQSATAGDDPDVRSFARQFLAVRDKRRTDYGLTAGLVAYETHTEWLEGLAKYIELSIWETAYNTPRYVPLPETGTDPDFKDYQTFKRRWDQEISQAKRQAITSGDVRFYYSGMLQARVLDRLMPGWKSMAMDEGAFLEDLIRQALAP